MKFLLAAAAAAVLFGSCAGSMRARPGGEIQTVSSWNNTERVTVRYGTVEGREKRGVVSWFGIPYAEPPIGELRWKAPKDPAPWSGVYQATAKPPAGMQYGIFPKKAVIGQEDCLYLNIWRPADETTELPVYVWIHGGGNSSGSSTFVSDYFGVPFVTDTQSVFVSINYRLGPFGWFTHPSLRTDVSSEDASGNYGLLDIQHALRWIQENIGAFGGDNANVTVAGESAGGINILALLQSPRSEGLFHKAIIRSGGIMQSTIAEGDKASEMVLRKLLKRDKHKPEEINAIFDTWSDTETAAYLRSVKAADILRCFEPRSFGMISLPLLFRDGTVLPAEGEDVFSDGTYPMKVPIIIGSNEDEVKLFFAGRRELRKQEQLYQAAAQLGSDRWRLDGVDSLVRKLVRHEEQPPLFTYYFRWGALDEAGESVLPCKRGELLGACHAAEVPFFHGTVDTSPFGIVFYTGKNRPGAEQLGTVIVQYTKDFLHMPVPGKAALTADSGRAPVWLPWTPGNGPKTLLLNADYTDLKLGMSEMEFTQSSVDRSLKENFPPEIYRKALDYVDENQLNLESLEKR
jgi:para-nitrobenzyl esterase